MLNPAVPGFHPDPSAVRVGNDYYLACSSFEYYPGIPLFHSKDGEHWTPIGHVVTRPGQVGIEHVPTGGGLWAPTIRYHAGVFYVLVCDFLGRGQLIFTATDPAGDWSDGIPMVGADGIDHDIAWDADGTCYVTYSGFPLDLLDAHSEHKGILQVRMDPATGHALELPRSMWSGTGLRFPEAPHLYEKDGYWYLMIAEGGTERGHAISIARGDSPIGPFLPAPVNPIYSHRSTGHPVQCAGHADLVHTDAGWMMVMLGTRPGSGGHFSPMGRETFAARVGWLDGWPVVVPMEIPQVQAETDVLTTFESALGGEWLSIRDVRREWLTRDGSQLRIAAPAASEDVRFGMDSLHPHFIGRRQQHHHSRFSALIGAADGVGGLAIRYSEGFHYDIELGEGVVRAYARLGQIEQIWEVPAPTDPVVLWIETVPVKFGVDSASTDFSTCDRIRLGFGEGADAREVANLDGRFLSSEVAASFTGRVVGVYAAHGTITAHHLRYEGLRG